MRKKFLIKLPVGGGRRLCAGWRGDDAFAAGRLPRLGELVAFPHRSHHRSSADASLPPTPLLQFAPIIICRLVFVSLSFDVSTALFFFSSSSSSRFSLGKPYVTRWKKIHTARTFLAYYCLHFTVFLGPFSKKITIFYLLELLQYA